MASGQPSAPSARRAVGETLRWIDDNELARPIFVGGLLIAALATLLIVLIAVRGEPVATAPAASPSAAPSLAEEPAGAVAYENLMGGYGFVYPSTWFFTENGSRARIESPNGRLVVTFGLASGGTLALASDREIETLLDGGSDHEMIGTTRERIAHSRSLLVSGTMSKGRSTVRFLAITVQADPRNYSISVVVPRGSDAESVLLLVEEIVSSFEILEPDEPIAS